MTALKVLPDKLPATVDDLLAHRKSDFNRTLNDLVEELHTALWEDDGYRNYLYAVYDEQAIEGSLSADNTLASQMIRDLAAKKGGHVAKEKLATISKALNIVLRRYGLSRKERRNKIDGKIVPESNGNS